MSKKLTKEEFISKCFITHGNKYDYSKLEFKNTNSKGDIICRIHGVFSQNLCNHLQGAGCPKCGNNAKHTKESFSILAAKIHKNKFTYDKVIYKDNKTHVVITCPIHGDFLMSPNSHLRGGACPECSKRKRYNTESYIKKAKRMHGDKYDYSLVNYVNDKTKIKIICNNCHKTFEQLPGLHSHGTGCPNHRGGFSLEKWINRCNTKEKDPILYIIRGFDSEEEFIKIGITNYKLSKRFSRTVFPYSYEILKEIKGSPDFVWNKEKELHKLCKPFKYKPKLKFSGETECFNLNCLPSLKHQI